MYSPALVAGLFFCPFWVPGRFGILYCVGQASRLWGRKETGSGGIGRHQIFDVFVVLSGKFDLFLR